MKSAIQSKCILFIMLVGSVLLAGGCASSPYSGGPGEVGVVGYIRGALTTTVANDYESVVQASVDAVREMQFVPVTHKRDVFVSIQKAETADDKTVDITITKLDDNHTRILIQVDTFGDEGLSRRVLEQIQRKL